MNVLKALATVALSFLITLSLRVVAVLVLKPNPDQTPWLGIGGFGVIAGIIAVWVWFLAGEKEFTDRKERKALSLKAQWACVLTMATMCAIIFDIIVTEVQFVAPARPTVDDWLKEAPFSFLTAYLIAVVSFFLRLKNEAEG